MAPPAPLGIPASVPGRARPGGRTWFGLAGGPAAWCAKAAAALWIEPADCMTAPAATARLAWSPDSAVALACAMVAGAAMWSAVAAFTEAGGAAADDDGAAALMGAAGFLVSGAFLLAIGFESLAVILLPSCGAQ